MATNKTIAMVLGIRPDVIRASLILKSLKSHPDVDLRFIWSGQHYSDNLKDVFFRELGVPAPDIELGCGGATDAETVSNIITKLYGVLSDIKPAATIFLGDTNTVAGCLASAQLNIPIVHIEGCMRSYDWRMPEEKYRSTIDHLSDVIYTYFPEYKQQGVAEGLNPNNIVVIGNLIVDVLQEYYFKRKAEYTTLANDEFFRARKVEKGNYYVMTCHRRENVEIRSSLEAVLALVGSTTRPVYFPASYRTQARIRDWNLKLPSNLIMVDPIGYYELVALMINSRGVITDSGTVVEETCVLGVPSVQMRRSTERPQVYDARSSVKFDPASPAEYPAEKVFAKLEGLLGTKWDHNLGDGRSSERVVNDIVRRIHENDFARRLPQYSHIPTTRSYQGDGL